MAKVHTCCPQEASKLPAKAKNGCKGRGGAKFRRQLFASRLWRLTDPISGKGGSKVHVRKAGM